nr:hypothetical protein Iba_chr04bCG15710 [Ipomoea batatas]
MVSVSFGLNRPLNRREKVVQDELSPLHSKDNTYDGSRWHDDDESNFSGRLQEQKRHHGCGIQWLWYEHGRDRPLPEPRNPRRPESRNRPHPRQPG